MLKFTVSGDYKHSISFLKKVSNINVDQLLRKYGERGVRALKTATPRNTGLTAESWNYKISKTNKGTSIFWTNSNTVDGVSVAIILQYGHATRSGSYIQGIDYINPAIKPVFNNILEELNTYFEYL